MKPKSAFWLGVGMIVVSQAAQFLLLLAANPQMQGDGNAVDAVVTIVSVFNLLLPLGVAFVALSLVCRALVRASRHDGGDAAEDPAQRDAFSPWNVLIAGVVLVAVGFLLDIYLVGWMQAASANRSLGRDFVFYLLPLVRSIALPLGILLVPSAWLLSVVQPRAVKGARAPTAGR